MKQSYFLILLILASVCQAQIANIPDANFKAALLSHNPVIDTNGDNEIQLTEAAAVVILDVNEKNISSLDGIQAFTNLHQLKCVSNEIATLDVSILPNLERLECVNNNLTSLNVTGLATLTYLSCSANELTSLDLTGTNNLESLICNNNFFTSFDVSNLPALIQFHCAYGPLTSVNVSGLTNLKELALLGNDLTSLDLTGLNLDYLNIEYNQLTGTLDLTPQSNLKQLYCSVNSLSGLQLTGLQNLTRVECSGNNLTTMDFSGLTSLSIIHCNDNNLTSVNLDGLSSLTDPNFFYNNLTSVSIPDSPMLMGLGFGNNNLSSLSVGQPGNVIVFNCSNNNFVEVNFSQFPSLLAAYCQGNQFQSIDVSQCHALHTLVFYDNPDLTSINLKNGHALPYFEVEQWQWQPFSQLAFICVDEENIDPLMTILQAQQLQNIQVNTYCSFQPGGPHNVISGVVSYDGDGNGCESGNLPLQSARVNISNGTETGAAFTNSAGEYSFITQAGNYTIAPIYDNPYFNATPTSANVTFANSDGSNQTVDVCVAPTGIQNDLEITLIPTTPARPGFDAVYQLVYRNNGNQMQSGTVTLEFEDALMDYVDAMPTTDSQTFGTLTWNYSALRPFESRMITLTLNINSPMETPAVNIGDQLDFDAVVNPVTGDETVADNYSGLKQIVVGSFDPNDKVCLEGSTIGPEKVGDYLHYLIRFQNSGTAAAENVVVRDIIDTAMLDVSTLQLIASSHQNETRITDNKIEFIFEGINLPAEINDEPGSHGYIAFKIKTYETLELGDLISNSADIFFDFNFPITTNTALTTITTLETEDFVNNAIVAYPNPVKQTLYISAKDTMKSLQLFDIEGRMLRNTFENSDAIQLDMGAYNDGAYLLKIKTESGSSFRKIIKH